MTSSICIPRIELSVTKEYVQKILSEMRIGSIKQIIEIPLRNEPSYKRIIIKLEWNNYMQSSINIQRQLADRGSIRLVHNMPWYWKIVTTYPQI